MVPPARIAARDPSRRFPRGPLPNPASSPCTPSPADSATKQSRRQVQVESHDRPQRMLCVPSAFLTELQGAGQRPRDPRSRTPSSAAMQDIVAPFPTPNVAVLLQIRRAQQPRAVRRQKVGTQGHPRRPSRPPMLRQRQLVIGTGSMQRRVQSGKKKTMLRCTIFIGSSSRFSSAVPARPESRSASEAGGACFPYFRPPPDVL
ncbi:hypothetical protein DFJ74DRAFT_318895 [Hyaloraphidium curvatum]|nr:hypothetical protein DFJ74DRAFT_318895 [Hyaloraphidium curvatum]